MIKLDQRSIRRRRPEHKEQRRLTILAATGRLFERQGLEGLTLSALAREAKLTKSNFYTYFESLEHVMGTLALQDWSDFVVTLEAQLARVARERHKPSDLPAKAASAWARSLVEHPRFCSLLSVLTPVIQKNVSLEELMSFKRTSRGLVLRLVNALHAAIPQLSLEGSSEVMTAMLGLVVGIWPITSPGDTMKELLGLPEFADHNFDVPNGLCRATELLIRGALAVDDEGIPEP